MSTSIGTHWVWILDVVFGAIITLAYDKLQEALHDASRISLKAVLLHVCVAIGFVSFVVYDVGAYHILIAKFPYSVTVWSGVRYALDLLIAFLLMTIVIRGVSKQQHDSVFDILFALTTWHIGAGLWHFAAALEFKHHVPEMVAYLPHVYFITGYWGLLALWWLQSRLRHVPFVAKSPGFVRLLSFGVLCVSVYRYIQIINLFGGGQTTHP